MAGLGKAELRKQIRQSRSTRTAQELAQVNRALATHNWDTLLKGSVIACYCAMENEPGTDLLIEELKNLGLSVFLPIISNNGSLQWGLATTNMVTNEFGIAEPTNPIQPTPEFSSVIMPAMAVGRDGSRLGRGGGYYDRWLETLPTSAEHGPLRIAVVFDNEVLQTLPVEKHDQRIDVIVTPDHIVYIND